VLGSWFRRRARRGGGFYFQLTPLSGGHKARTIEVRRLQGRGVRLKVEVGRLKENMRMTIYAGNRRLMRLFRRSLKNPRHSLKFI